MIANFDVFICLEIEPVIEPEFNDIKYILEIFETVDFLLLIDEMDFIVAVE
jgi:hypothetical protein